MATIEERKKRLGVVKYLIAKSKDSNDLTKKICLFLLDKSDLLSKTLRLKIVPDEKLSQDAVKAISYGMHNMLSSNDSTHLSEILELYDTPYRFFFNYERIKNETFCTNIWLSFKSYDNLAEKVEFDLSAIESVDLV